MSGYGQTSFFVLPACRLVLFWADIGPTEITLGQQCPVWWVYPPLSLIQNRTDDFCASLAHLRRKALHLPTQSFASANAKHCICQRKALHAHAKLCIRLRKALHWLSLKHSLGKGVFILKSLSHVFQTLGSAWCALLSLSAGDQCCRWMAEYMRNIYYLWNLQTLHMCLAMSRNPPEKLFFKKKLIILIVIEFFY